MISEQCYQSFALDNLGSYKRKNCLCCNSLKVKLHRINPKKEPKENKITENRERKFNCSRIKVFSSNSKFILIPDFCTSKQNQEERKFEVFFLLYKLVFFLSHQILICLGIDKFFLLLHLTSKGCY